MSSPFSNGPILPVSWADVLDRVSEALRIAEAEALRAEQALTPPPLAPSNTAPSSMDRLRLTSRRPHRGGEGRPHR